MKITILEGPDGSGKTTLAKTGYPGRDYIHYGQPPKGKLGAWKQYHKLLVKLWEEPQVYNDLVIDRFIHGELIYGPILRGGTDMTWGHIRMLERVLLGLEAELVVCLPPYEEVYKNWYENIDNELIKDPLQISNVYDFYMKLAARDSLVPRRIWDYTQPMELRRYTLGARYANQGPGIGMFCPGNTLLIGDRVNENVGYHDWPFVATNGSSVWLANELEDARIPEHSLYWVNSVIRGQEINPLFIDKLQPELVVALGGNAARWCQKHKIGHTAFEHPAYHKRFKYAEPYPLIEKLRYR